MKRALVIRLGAYGDVIQATCTFRYFTGTGYELTVNVDEFAMVVLENNPHVAAVIPHVRDSVPISKLKDHWYELGRGYDKVVPLSGNVVESSLLWGFRDYMYWASPTLRRKVAGRKNYFEEYIKEAGFKPQPPCRGELYLSDAEKVWARNFVKKTLRGRYVMVYGYSGSSANKGYVWYGQFLFDLLERWKDLVVVTVGGPECAWLDLDHPRIINTSGLWNFRHTVALMPYVHLVVGQETGTLNAASCFPVPKVCLLTHSSRENFTKYWENDYSIQMPCDCSPCHRLYKYIEDYLDCPRTKMGFSVCQEVLRPEELVKHVQRVREETYGKVDFRLGERTRTGHNQVAAAI